MNTNKQQDFLREGMVKKGGINFPPTHKRPEPPKPQTPAKKYCFKCKESH